MSIENLLDILLDGIDCREKYLEVVPEDLQAAIFDNGYSNSLEDTLTKTLYALLPDEVVDDIFWFLYDWEPGFEISLKNDNVYTINDKGDFIKYLKERYA